MLDSSKQYIEFSWLIVTCVLSRTTLKQQNEFKMRDAGKTQFGIKCTKMKPTVKV